MLRKRTRSVHKDQNMGASDSYFNFDVVAQRHRKNSFFNVSCLFGGQNHKVLLDYDSVRSPTSPLEFRVFSNLGNPFRTPKSWDSDKVGLSIIDSIAGNGKVSGEIKRPSDSRNIVFGPQMRIKAPNSGTPIGILEASKSLPGDYAVFPPVQIKSSNIPTGNSHSLFEIGGASSEPDSIGAFRSCSLDSGCRIFLPLTNTRKSNLSSNLSSANAAMETDIILANPTLQPIEESVKTGILSNIHEGPVHEVTVPLSAGEIERSEDYTRVITHGPNPKTTHIYGDCILGCHSEDLSNFTKRMEQKFVLPRMAWCNEISAPFPSDHFLNFCYFCNKKLAGKDIYMYRGEKAFCSLDCRQTEMIADAEMEGTPNDSSAY